ncbi:hypothetical protein NLG97_g752 [Lecanicillium saksenae]|uniref:Uncharacterized protein n=1 Tax=Lecanicillium saksenae TaxID=468837 RepID=A0ACC1R5L8_9HYPO|nr:hypothetical protein NLG97_g752 [Lecanicillium saksenae]
MLLRDATKVVGRAWLLLVTLSPACGAMTNNQIFRKSWAECGPSKDDNCLTEHISDLDVFKCSRCQEHYPELMANVGNTSPELQKKCYDMINDEETHYSTYYDRGSLVKSCTTPRNLLYDGAVGCICGGGVMLHCSQGGDISKSTAPSCPSKPVARQAMPQGAPRAYDRSQPKPPKAPKGKSSGTSHAASKAQQSDDNDAEETDDDDGSGDDGEEEFIDDDNGSVDTRAFPPDPEEQFSPILDDREVSFYIDIYERVVYVDQDTHEFIDFEPYVRYPAASYDEIHDSPVENTKYLRRNYFYPLSNRVWYYQWLVGPDVYKQYATQDSDSSRTIGASSGYTFSDHPKAQATQTAASANPTTSPGATAAATSSGGLSNVASSTASVSSSTAASTPSGSSSAAASRLVPLSWLLMLQLLAIAYHGI